MRRCWIKQLFMLLFLTSLTWSQGARVPQPSDPVPNQSQTRDADRDRDKDQTARRDQWFLHGRLLPGESAAALRFRAHQQKMKLRAARLATAPQAGTNSPVPSSPPVIVWKSLGPAPLNSDSTGGFQDYGWVSGRATAVAVDPTDATGNTVYIGGAYGGLWKSSNATSGSYGNASGVIWTPRIDDQATLAVGAIAVSPDPNNHVVLVGTGETNSSIDSYYGLGILRSTDAGGSWNLITQDSTHTRSFAGMGFSKIAFSTANSAVVVAAAGSASQGDLEGLENPANGANRGIYYSLDAGASWTYASVNDSGVPVAPGSVTSVAYNAASGKFFAALRSHGFYSSNDGITWTRLAAQPGALLTTAACPANPSSGTCPIYRGEIAVVNDANNPTRNEMYVWFVDSASTNQHIWKTTDSGASWTQLTDTGVTNCGDAFGGCGTAQGIYNLELGAVPNGSNSTDVYAGAINIFKCAITAGAPTCGGTGTNTFLNLTHVYGCSPLGAPAHVHPDQHDLDFMVVNGHSILYFANDGGIYRALDGYLGLNTGSCSGTNQFDSLNQTLGSMTQFVSFSQHPTDAGTMLGGTQDNGSPATDASQSSTTWQNVNGGDGGYNEINQDNPLEWFTANIDVSIQRCTFGIECTAQDFGSNLVISNASVGGDSGAFYTPYILDPLLSSQLIAGTCRVWRGSSDGSGAGWATGGGSALSPNFETGSGGCTGSEVNLVRSLAAGGISDVSGSTVIYAGTDGFGPLGSTGGRLWASTSVSGGTGTWADRTAGINPNHFPISGVAVDSSDVAGLTAYVTIMGFHVSHVFKTSNGGLSWTDFTGTSPNALPDAPANAVLVDPGQTPVNGTLYVATDVGVYSSSTSSPAWTEVGPAPDSELAGYLPNVAVTALRMFKNGGSKKLRASTYGRGIWEFDLLSVPDFQITFNPSTLTIFPLQTASFEGTLKATDGYSSNVDLSCTTGTPPLPVPCLPSLTPLLPTPGGVAFTVAASGAIGDYSFNLHGVGEDANTVTHDAPLLLRVVDFGLTAPVPNSVTVNVPHTSDPVIFQATASGSFSSTVALGCTGLPAGASCNFLPSNVVSPTSVSPVTVTLTIGTISTTPAGAYPVMISATTSGAPAAKTQPLTLIVTALADYALHISNPAQSATVNASATFSGTLTASNGYNSAVVLTCGTGGPPACTASPVTPTANGAPFTVTVSSDLVHNYAFNIVGTGTDPLTLIQTQAVTFNSTFDFSLTDTTGPITVNAGGSAVYSLEISPAGGTFPNDVTLSSSGCPTRSVCSFSPPAIASGSPDTFVNFTVITTAPIASSVSSRSVWLVPGVLLLFTGLDSRTRRRRLIPLLWIALAFLIALETSCGGAATTQSGGGQGTPHGTYQIIVTATSASGGPTHSTQVNLTVQ